jgi:2-keto-3-deoxy-L-rhamnonate aldolase RhmA
MAPRVDSAEQALHLVTSTRYPPTGTRGVALMNRAAAFGRRSGGPGKIDELLLVVAQVESPQAVAAAPDIAAIDGVDVLFVGPSDLSHSLGCFGQFDDQRYVGAVKAVAEACRAAGKAAGVLAGSPENAERYLEEGYRFVGVSGDAGFVASGAASAAAGLRARVRRAP